MSAGAAPVVGVDAPEGIGVPGRPVSGWLDTGIPEPTSSSDVEVTAEGVLMLQSNAWV